MSANRLCEHDLKATVLEILDAADAAGCTVHLPYDVVVAKEFAANPASLRTCNVHEVAADEMILDVGPAAVEALADALKTCKTLVWNGPMGAFETPPFDTATVALARTAAALTKKRHAGFGRRRRRYRRGAQPCRCGGMILPSSPPQAAPSWSGWRAGTAGCGGVDRWIRSFQGTRHEKAGFFLVNHQENERTLRNGRSGR
jgi:hypothetical protein